MVLPRSPNSFSTPVTGPVVKRLKFQIWISIAEILETYVYHTIYENFKVFDSLVGQFLKKVYSLDEEKESDCRCLSGLR